MLKGQHFRMFHRHRQQPGLQLQGFLRRLARDTAGNTLAMIAAGLLPLLAMVGGGIDMGRSYLAQTRLQQACDAGVLAARKKLGSQVVADGTVPSDIATVGNQYFNVNFLAGSYGTANRDFQMTLEEDYSISGTASVDVPTSIMSIFGYANVGVDVACEAALNFSNTDIMFVLDTTGSMTATNPSDSQPRIDALKGVVRSFHAQLEGSKGPGIRLRYGFVPYSTNVNVGGLLEDDWVVNNWTYQSREDYGTEDGGIQYHTYTDNWVDISGSQTSSFHSAYLATYHPATSESGSEYWSCDTAPPASTATWTETTLSHLEEIYPGPPAGFKTTDHMQTIANGTYYWVERVGPVCTVRKTIYTNYKAEFDRITIPYTQTIARYRYAPIARNVSAWRSQTAGCVEERSTYEITDYDNVDLSQALDLNLDAIPTASDPDTQWRPSYPGAIWERELDGNGNGTFNQAAVITTNGWFYKPEWNGAMIACPTPARKLAEMDPTQLDNYLGTVTPSGTTYHDIGMIWGGRLLSPTGLFAAENGDVDSKVTSRHLIFLTDGQTEPYDIAYGAYGVEPLDQRRWNQSSSLTLSETIEARFGVACKEVKKRNITVWVIGFGTTLNPAMTECAGPGKYFEAADAAQLQTVFSKIAARMGDLRVSK
jgi:Flp pilus assembly protein TadG